MNDQLQLVDGTERPWRLDARTRAAGRRGVAQAREALRQATAHRTTAHQTTAHQTTAHQTTAAPAGAPTSARGRAA